MKNLKANLHLWGLGVLTSVYLIYGLLFRDAQGYVSVGNKILITLLIAALALFLRKSLIWYSAFMLVGKKPFNKKVDRPRVFFFTLFYGWLLIIYFVFYRYMIIPLENSVAEDQFTEAYTGASAIFVIGIMSFVLLLFIFSEKFERIYLPKLKKTSRAIEGSKSSSKKRMKKERVEEIFENLKEQGFLVLEADKAKENKQKNELVRLLTSSRSKSKDNWVSEVQNREIAGDIPRVPIIKVEMKNAELKIFFDNLRKETNLFYYYELAEIFGNKNGESFNYNSVGTTAEEAKESGTYDVYEKRVLEVFKRNTKQSK